MDDVNALIAGGSTTPARPIEDTFARLQQIRDQRQTMQQQHALGAQQLQSGALDIQDRQRQMAQTQAVNQAYSNALKLNADGTPDIDTGALTNALATGGHGSAIPGILKGINEYKASSAALSKTQGEVNVLEQDAGGSLGAAVKSANNDPNLFLTLGQHAVAAKHVDAATIGPLLQQVQAAQQQDPSGNAARTLVGQITDHLVAQSPAQQKLANERMTAEGARDRGTAALGELGLRKDEEPNQHALAAATLAQKQRENAGNQVAMALEAEKTQPGTYARVFGGLSPEMQATFANAKTPADARRLAMTPDQVVTTDQAAKSEADAERDRKVTQGQGQQRINQEGQRIAIDVASKDPFGALGINKNPIAGAPAGATGAQYLATLPAGMQTRVQAIAEGRETLTAREKGSPQGQALQTAVETYEPGWSEQRAQLRKAFTVGPDGRNIGNLNTATVHLDQLHEVAKAMNNGTFTPGNAAWNFVAQKLGSAAPTNRAFVMNALAGEAASALKGNATDPEIAHVLSTLQSDQSPQQLEGVTVEGLKTLGAKLNTYDERYHAQSSANDQWSPVLPQAKAVFARYGVNPITRTSQAAAPPTGSFPVTDPRGVVHTFPTQAAADSFKQAAGIR